MSAPSALPLEPSPERLRNPALRYVLATRPAFLSITLAGCLLGFATAFHDGVPFRAGAAEVSLLLALLAHAGINVLNDYFDHLNGTDAANVGRIYPYTGGSRFIQNGVLSPGRTLAFGLLLFAFVIAGGLWLVAQSGAGLFWIGLAGLITGWAYSAPPLKLNARGLGEPCVVAGFLLIPAGADYVQRASFAPLPWLASLPFALLAANILFINQFPDREADALAGKRHWVVRLEPEQAAGVYALIALAAAGALVAAVAADALPVWALSSLAAMLPSVGAARQLMQNCRQPRLLAPAIRLTLLAAHLHAIMLALILMTESGK
ncbi:MAG: prenyltransferase [Pseudomonadota bacterium]